MAAIRDCWISGGSAISLSPAAWRPALEDADPAEAERRLLAIAGQAVRMIARPMAPKNLVHLPPIPQLALPTLPDPIRPLFRAAIESAGRGSVDTVVCLIAQRGYVAHPGDWLPTVYEWRIPEVYAPWQDWVRRSTETGGTAGAISVENWNAFAPQDRYFQLRFMRRCDPGAARALIEAKATSVPPDQRVALIRTLEEGLGEGDVPLLESFASDRSGKVRERVALLLTKLGHGDPPVDIEREVKEFFLERKVGLLKRKRAFAPAPIDSDIRRARCEGLLAVCSLSDLGRAFSVADHEFVEHWQFGDDWRLDDLLIGNIARTGSDAAVASICSTLNLTGYRAIAAAEGLMPRLDRKNREILFLRILDRDPETPVWYPNMKAPDLSWLDLDRLRDNRAWLSLNAALGRAAAKFTERYASRLFGLAILVTADTARVLIEEFAGAGQPIEDPAFSLLRLNAALG